MLNIKKYINQRYAINCKNEDEVHMLSIYLDSLGYTWCNNTSYITHQHLDYKEETCYYPFDGTYCDLEYFISNSYKVIKFEEIDPRFKNTKFIPDFKIQKIQCTN